MNFLSRDIVFLFPDNHAAMERFYENIFDASSKSKVFKKIPTNILASLNIEINGRECASLDSFIFKYEGDQLLPYMDLINTLTKIADFHGLNARFDGDFKRKISEFPVVFEASLRQFIGHLNSGHSYLLK